MLGIREKSNNMHFSFVPNTHSQKDIAAEDRRITTYITFLFSKICSRTELRRQFHLHNGFRICWPRSSSANHRQSPALLYLQMHSVTTAAPNRMCYFIGHHQGTCPCILFFYPVSTPFPKIGHITFLAICIVAQYLLVSPSFV